jgi:Terpene cyclase DEP1
MNIKPIQVLYAALGIGGLLGTSYFNAQSANMKISYLQGWFANSASSSASLDLLVLFVTVSLFMMLEGRRIGMRFTLMYALLALPTAIAFTFPMFLLVRDRHLRKSLQ